MKTPLAPRNKPMDRWSEKRAAQVEEVAAGLDDLGRVAGPLPPKKTPAEFFLEQFDVTAVVKDLLRGVDDPGPALLEAAQALGLALRWSTVIDKGHLGRIAAEGGGWSSESSLIHARITRDYQQLVRDRQLSLQLMIARHQELAVRVTARRGRRNGMQAVRAA